MTRRWMFLQRQVMKRVTAELSEAETCARKVLPSRTRSPRVRVRPCGRAQDAWVQVAFTSTLMPWRCVPGPGSSDCGDRGRGHTEPRTASATWTCRCEGPRHTASYQPRTKHLCVSVHLQWSLPRAVATWSVPKPSALGRRLMSLKTADGGIAQFLKIKLRDPVPCGGCRGDHKAKHLVL